MFDNTQEIFFLAGKKIKNNVTNCKKHIKNIKDSRKKADIKNIRNPKKE